MTGVTSRRRGGKLIGTRWLDVNKSDAAHPDYRSRLVGKEYRQGADDSLYASTPPLEAMRAILSHAATLDDDDDASCKKGRRRR